MSYDQSRELVGDVEIHSTDRKCCILQLQGLHAQPLIPLSETDDKDIFFEMVWGPETPSGGVGVRKPTITDDMYELSLISERLSCLYLKILAREYPSDKRSNLSLCQKSALEYVDQSLELSFKKGYAYPSEAWKEDTEDIVTTLF